MPSRCARLGLLPIAIVAMLGSASLGTQTTAASRPAAPAAAPLEIIGQLGGAPHDVVLRGGYAYLATGYAFEVWDLRDPVRPVRVSRLVRRGFLPSPANADISSPTRLSLDGPYAYLLDRNMVRIIDISDPEAPHEAGVYAFWTDITHMAVRGNSLYLTASAGGVGVAVVDVADPSSPKLVSYTADGIYSQLAFVGDTLLAIGNLSDTGSGQNGVRAFDISVPQAPRGVAVTSPIQIKGNELAVSAAYLYAAWDNGLHVYDVADPSAILEVAHYRTTAPITALDLANGRAYILQDGLVEVLDIADPSQPRSLGSLPIVSGSLILPGVGYGGDASIAVGDGVAVVVGRNGIVRLIDFSDAAHLRELARLDADLPWCERIAVGPQHVYMANWSLHAPANVLTVVDVSNPASPVIVGGYALPNDSRVTSIHDLAVQGTRLYMLVRTQTESGELYVLDVTNPAAPRRESVIDLGTTIGDGLIVRGSLAYVAAYVNGESRRQLQVVDLGAPAGPRLIGTVEIAPATPSYEGPPTLALLGHHVLLGLHNGIAVIDVQDAVRPVLVSRFKVASTIDVRAVAASPGNGYHVYRTNPDSKLHIGTIDISDVAMPQLASTYEPNWVPLNLGLSADHLFAGSPSGVQMFDFSRPERLRRVGSVSLPSEVRGIVLRNGYAYVADGDAGLFILHTGDADLPEVVPPTRTPVPPPSSTPFPTPGLTATPPGPAGPVARVCPQVVGRVPGAVLDAALANPERIQGWNQLQNPSVPAGPFNPRRVWLTIRSMGVPFDWLFNPVLYRASCP